jgi:hypothetical protein
MRETSLYLSKQNSQQPKYQGGEKKVMKKSLSLLLAFAMVFSMFSSLAFAADTELTAQQKYDALAAKGIFAGINGEAALDQNMNRAQFARVAALILGLEGVSATDTTFVTEKPFSDVELGLWYTDEIAAAKKAGVFVGNTDGTFDPKGDITVQQLAVVVSGLLGLEAVEDATVEGAAPWAAGYIQAIINAGVDFPANYTQPATRADLASLAYTADAKINPAVPANIGIDSAKATGAKEITVTLNGPVDTATAKFEVKRNGSTQTVETPVWSEDKKVVKLPLSSKIVVATYEVTFSGITNLDSDKAKAEFQGQDEKITSIEILTASETLPLANAVRVDFQALNQYGVATEQSASSFTIAAGSYNANSVSGAQAITLDLLANGAVKGDKVPVTIIHTESNTQTNKIFTVGEAPIVSKIELGDLKNGDNETIESIEIGKTAYIEYKAYDQYGVAVTNATLLNGSTGVTVVIPDSNLVKGDTPSSQTNPAFVANTIGDFADDLAISAISTASAKDVTVTFFANGTGQSAQKVIKITTPKVPATVEFGEFSKTLAVDDDNVYVPLVVKDDKGNTLTAQEIADNAGKFTVYATGGVVTLNSDEIKTSTSDKGKVWISTVDRKGNGTIVVQLTDNPNQKSTLNISVTDRRLVDRIAVSSKAADKLIHTATSGVKLKIFDQHGGNGHETSNTQIDTSTYDDYYVTLKVERVSGDTDAASLSLGGVAAVDAASAPVTTLDTSVTEVVYATVNEVFDTEMTWNAHATKSGTLRLTAILYDAKGDGIGGTAKDVELGKVQSTVIVYDAKSANLTYTVKLDKSVDNTLYAAPKFNSTWTAATDVTTAMPLLSKEVDISAKEGSATVALPADVEGTASVTSSNPAVVAMDGLKAVGLATGSSDLNVMFKTPTGFTTSTVKATVKEERPAVATITVGNSSKNATATGTLTSGTTILDYTGDIKAKDQYGSEYVEDDDLTPLDITTTYSTLLNIKFFISNVSHIAGSSADSIGINATTGALTYVDGNSNGINDIASFTINIIAPSGVIASTEVSF